MEIPQLMDAGRRLIVAHRAGNCLDELREAERLGVDVVEADLRLFRGRVEVRHLNTVGPIPLLWDTWKLGNPFAPRLQLEDLLATVSPETNLMLDLKGINPRLARRAFEQLREHHVGKLTVCARNWRLLRPFEDQAGIRVVHSVGNRWQLRELNRRAARGGRMLDGVSIRASLLDKERAQALVQRARLVMAWPVNSTEQARKLRDWGIHGMITDIPETIAAALRPATRATTTKA